MDIKICDICGKTLNVWDSYFYRVTAISYLTDRKKDVCKSCFEKIEDEIRNGSGDK